MDDLEYRLARWPAPPLEPGLERRVLRRLRSRRRRLIAAELLIFILGGLAGLGLTRWTAADPVVAADLSAFYVEDEP